jgi:hypothetical protein
MKKNILLLAIFALGMALPAMASEPEIEAAPDFESPVAFTTEADAEMQNIKIEVEGTQVHISNAEGLTLEVYNLTGVRVGNYKIDSDDKVINLNLKYGCYILKVGKVVRKAPIRP